MSLLRSVSSDFAVAIDEDNMSGKSFIPAEQYQAAFLCYSPCRPADVSKSVGDRYYYHEQIPVLMFENGSPSYTISGA